MKIQKYLSGGRRMGVAALLFIVCAVGAQAEQAVQAMQEQADASNTASAQQATAQQLSATTRATTAAVPPVPPGEDVDAVTRDDVLTELSSLLASATKEL